MQPATDPKVVRFNVPASADSSDRFGGGGVGPRERVFLLPQSEPIVGAGETDMTDHTQELVDAKLQAVEARLDTKLTAMDGKLERFLDKATSLNEQLAGEVLRMREDVKEIKTDNKSTRTTTIVTGIGSVLAIAALIIGLWAAGISVQQTLISAFQAGQQVAPATPTTKKD